MKVKEEKPKTIKLEDIKCPVCGGKINRYVPMGWYFDQVELLCECWSGDLHISSNYHLFKVRAPICTLNIEEKEKVKKE